MTLGEAIESAHQSALAAGLNPAHGDVVVAASNLVLADALRRAADQLSAILAQPKD